MEELSVNPIWTGRLQEVLKKLPEDISEYKGLSRYRDTVITWLAQNQQEQKVINEMV